MITKRASCSRSSFDEDSDRDENLTVIARVSSSRKKSYRKWIKDEDERLRGWINSNGGIKDWSLISQHVGNGRTDAQCQHRWERFLDPSITKGPWTDEEDKKVIELVRDHGARQWSLIAKELNGRVGKQCRERWHNHLNPAINKNPWTNNENLLLFILHEHFGNKWAEIARHFNGRSDNSIKNHWNSSMKKKFDLEVANLKRQGLEWTTLIPSDFPWPKLDKPTETSNTMSRSSRTPLTTITNQTTRSSRPSNVRKSSVDKKVTLILPSSASPVVQNDDRFVSHMHDSPMMNSNSNHHFYSTEHHNYDLLSNQHVTTIYSEQLQPLTSSQPPNDTQEQHGSSQDLERMFYCTPPSPVKQLPMLSSCASYTPPSQNSQPHHHHHHASLIHAHTSSSLYSSLDYFQHPPSRSSSLPVYGASSSHSTVLSTQHPSYHNSMSFENNSNLYTNETHDDPFSLSFGSQRSQNQTNTTNITMIKQEADELLIGFTQPEPQRVSPTNISNSSSPSKHRVLNTPERLDESHRIRLTPSPKLASSEQDMTPWYTEFFPLSQPTLTTMHPRINENNKENRSSIRPTIVRRNKRLHRYQSTTMDHPQRGPMKKRDNLTILLSSPIQFDPLKKIKDELGYDATYTEILMGQTRDQRHMTDQAKRFLSCTSLNNYNT